MHTRMRSKLFNSATTNKFSTINYPNIADDDNMQEEEQATTALTTTNHADNIDMENEQLSFGLSHGATVSQYSMRIFSNFSTVSY